MILFFFKRDELNVSTIEMSLMNQQIDPESCIDSDEKSRSAFIPYAFAILIFMFPFIIGHTVGRWGKLMISFAMIPWKNKRIFRSTIDFENLRRIEQSESKTQWNKHYA